jgi:hypothetical protein
LIPLPVEILIIALPTVSIVVFLLVWFQKDYIDKAFPGLITKRRQQRAPIGIDFTEASPEVGEELTTVGKVVTSKKTWLSAGLTEIVIIIAILVFYLTATMIAWRIRRSIVNTPITPSVEVSIVNQDAILKGSVGTDKLYIDASRKAAEIIGVGHVINRLQVEQPEFLGVATDRIGSVQITVDSFYDDSPESISQISAVVNLPQVEALVLERESTLARVIESRYGITLASLPKSFRVVANRINELNRLIPPEERERLDWPAFGEVQIPPGTITIPVLPVRFAAPSKRITLPSREGKRSIFGFETANVFGSLLKVTESLRPHESKSREVLLQLPFTRGTAEETQRAAKVLPLDLLESSMTIQFASSDTRGSAAHVSLDSDNKKAVIGALARPANREATVYVLDSGWPDESSYRSSLAALRSLVDSAVSYYGLDKVQWTEQPYVPLPNDPKSQHCVYIMNSLHEFTDLDSRHIVKVVYVPLDTKQNSSQIISESLRLYRIRKLKQDLTQVDTDTLQAAQKFSTDTLASIASGESYDFEGNKPASRDAMYQARWRTNSAIVAAVWYLAELAAKQDPHNPVFFLNESWTVLPDTVELGAPDVSSGLVVAAAGNTPGKEVNSDNDKIDFARDATPAKNVLAALDSKPGLGAPFCESSQLRLDSLSFTMAAAFDGEVVDGGLCGTSFSAPRVAWLLALREATRSQYLEESEWSARLQQELLSMRKPSASMFESLYLYPKDLLQ